MRNKESDSWVWGQDHMVLLGEGFGTVPVGCSVQDLIIGAGCYKRTPSGSPPPQPPPLPPPAGASGAPAGFSKTQELSPMDTLIQDDSIFDEQIHLSDDEDFGNDLLPKTDSRKDWWKPLPEEQRPATPEPTWTIPSSIVSEVETNWATALASTYVTPAKKSLLAKTRDMTNFLNWYCRQVNTTKLTQADLEGQAYEVVKAFYPNDIHFQFQMEEWHELLTDQVDWTNPEGDQVRVDVNRPLPLGSPPCHVTIQSQFFFNKYLEYLSHGSKGRSLALSISLMKAASYPDFGLELLVPEQIWIEDVCTYDISAKVDLQEHTIAEKDFKNLHPSDFEDPNLLLMKGHLDHLSVFQLGTKSYQTQLNLTKPRWDDTCYEFKHDYTIIESPQAVVFPVNNTKRKIIRFNEIYKFSDDTLTRILETLVSEPGLLVYRVKEFKIKQLNPVMNMSFWTQKDVTRSKEFIAAIERHDSSSRKKKVKAHMQILSVVRSKAYSRYGCDYLSEIFLRRADLQEHTIVEKDFKNLYPSNFEDLNLLLLQGHLDHIPGSDKRMLSPSVKLWT
nr:hypothetical protein [Tanacetum cinerariifolium]